MRAYLPRLAEHIDAADPDAFVESFTEELRAAKRNGFAINNEQSREGVVAGALLLAPQGAALDAPIALSIAAPASRWSAEDARRTMQELLAVYANDIPRAH